MIDDCVLGGCGGNDTAEGGASPSVQATVTAPQARALARQVRAYDGPHAEAVCHAYAPRTGTRRARRRRAADGGLTSRATWQVAPCTPTRSPALRRLDGAPPPATEMLHRVRLGPHRGGDDGGDVVPSVRRRPERLRPGPAPWAVHPRGRPRRTRPAIGASRPAIGALRPAMRPGGRLGRHLLRADGRACMPFSYSCLYARMARKRALAR